MKRSTSILGLTTMLTGCAGTQVPPLQATRQKVDLERFMGDWYVLAAIPVDLPFVSEADAYDAVESYRLTEDGTIATTYTFRDGGFDGPLKRMTPTGYVYDTETNAEWRMQFLWPFRSAYLIVHLDEAYETTIIGVPDRSYVWIMARSPDVTSAQYEQLVRRVEEVGYDTKRIRRVPHSDASTGAS